MAGAERASVAAALGQLGKIERRVLELRYGLAGETPHSPTETARSLGVKPHQVRQVEDRALRTLGALPGRPGPARSRLASALPGRLTWSASRTSCRRP